MMQRVAFNCYPAMAASCALRGRPQPPIQTSSYLPTPQRQPLCRGIAAISEGARHHTVCDSLHESRSRAPLHRLRALVGAGGSASTGEDGAASEPGSSTPSSWTSVATTTMPPTSEEAPSWPALEPPFSYYASAEDAQSNSAPSGLSPVWKVLLLSDGSVTRHLQLLSGSPVTVECLSQRNVGWSLDGMPPGTELIPGPRVQRQVLLRCQPVPGVGSPASNRSSSSSNDSSSSNHGGSASASGSYGRCSSSSSSGGSSSSSRGSSTPPGLPLVYASSWWNADSVDEYLRDKSKPIWMSLSQGHVELYREVHALFRGGSGELEELLGCRGPFWGRQYVFWSGGRPLTLIYEVFSPRLQEYLGAVAESESGDETE